MEELVCKTGADTEAVVADYGAEDKKNSVSSIQQSTCYARIM